MAASSTSINFYSMAPEAKEILLRIADTNYAQYICEFLEECECYSVRNIGSLSYGRSEVLTSFAEFVSTKRLKSGIPANPRFVKFASISLTRFIDECHGGDPFNDACSPAAHTPVKTLTTLESRNSSTSSSLSSSLSSTSPPSKKLKMLEPGKLLHLKVDHPLF